MRRGVLFTRCLPDDSLLRRLADDSIKVGQGS